MIINIKSKNLLRIIIMIIGIIVNFMVYADNVAINFTGTIKAGTCDLSSGTDQVVPLGNISTTTFGNPGDVSQAKSFSIVLDCPASGPSKVTVTFNGAAASDPTLLALDDGPGVATGVAVRINETDGSTQVKLNSSSAITTLNTGINTLQFTAQYQSLVDRPRITAGSADATAQFTIDYP